MVESYDSGFSSSSSSSYKIIILFGIISCCLFGTLIFIISLLIMGFSNFEGLGCFSIGLGVMLNLGILSYYTSVNECEIKG